jgi:hypothetical protein
VAESFQRPVLQLSHYFAHARSILLHPLRIGWDPALHLQCAQLIAGGGLPYVDMFDVNPPLIWYLDILPSLLSTASNVPVTLAFNLFMLLLMVICSSLCAYIALTKLKQEGVYFSMGAIWSVFHFDFILVSEQVRFISRFLFALCTLSRGLSPK